MGDYIERYVVTEKPVVEEGKLTVGNVVATYRGAKTPIVTQEKLVNHPEDHIAVDTVYLIDFAVDGTEFEIRIELK